MKEINISRAKKIVNELEKFRGMLAVINSNNYSNVVIHIETRAIFNGYNAARLINEDVPVALKQVTACLLKAEFERQIKALEDELETL